MGGFLRQSKQAEVVGKSVVSHQKIQLKRGSSRPVWINYAYCPSGIPEMLMFQHIRTLAPRLCPSESLPIKVSNTHELRAYDNHFGQAGILLEKIENPHQFEK